MIFTVEWWPDSGTRVWVFLYNANTQELFEQTNTWDRADLKNFQNFKTAMKYFAVAWPDSGTRIGMFLYNVSTLELF